MIMIKSAVVVAATAATFGVAAMTQLTTRALGARNAETAVIELESAPTAEISTVGPADSKAAKAFKGFKVSGQTQVLPISGTKFETGLIATLEAPLGVSTTFPASAIGDLTPTSFTLGVTLDEPGTYLLTVRNPGGARSKPAPIVVKR